MFQGDEHSAVSRMILQCKIEGHTASDVGKRITKHQMEVLLISLFFGRMCKPGI